MQSARCDFVQCDPPLPLLGLPRRLARLRVRRRRHAARRGGRDQEAAGEGAVISAILFLWRHFRISVQRVIKDESMYLFWERGVQDE